MQEEQRDLSFPEGPFQSPAISLPKGGGAVRGIDEKFAVAAATGSASLNLPIHTSPGRSRFFPKLSLAYDSGSGNSVFGIGWGLNIPNITRKTAKGLPRYLDGEESDTFILSNAEDLVPKLIKSNGLWEKDEDEAEIDGSSYIIRRYRPRTEGLFARCERWTDVSSGISHWRSISKENVTSIFGRSPEARIADPDDPSRIFSWLLELSYDDKGNIIHYIYKSEDLSGVSDSVASEKHRIETGKPQSNRYIKRIRYGNKTPYQRNGVDILFNKNAGDWLFEVVFDYGEHDLNKPTPQEDASWKARSDAFSDYHPGFEVRTFRLCRRVLMFHRFQELLPVPCLVKSTDFEQDENPVASRLAGIRLKGYLYDSQSGEYRQKSLPLLEFFYFEPEIGETVQFVDRDSLQNLPIGAHGKQYHWVDLDGEGLPGILSEQENAWYYKRNLGDARFAPVETVAAKPSPSQSGSSGLRLLDLAGDGRKDLALFTEQAVGFFERRPDRKWDNFKEFGSFPNINWGDPNLRFIDLNGDGHADILMTENDVFIRYPSRGEEGFGPAEISPLSQNEETGPLLIFSDPGESVFLADMSGDGPSDIVRIRNHEVCYWPNLGYGRFGRKVVMDSSPRFDFPDSFDQKRIRLADIDGSGTTDIIYLGKDGIRIWANQSGNSWGAPKCLRNTPVNDPLTAIDIQDLFGSGTACIVWSASESDTGRMPVKYLDLMTGKKPHLLKSFRNNMGSETRLTYAPSTKFYLQDKAEGNPWITRLPFPVHVLEKVEIFDWISRTKFVSRYRYHHGFFDGDEREFRGFGMVEREDTEDFESFQNGGTFPGPAANADPAFHLPPVRVKTWYHTGAYRIHNRISRQYEDEYYRPSHWREQDFLNSLLPDTVFPPGLNFQEAREACRVLKGKMLRQETYALDDGSKSEHPYLVSERNYQLKKLQPLEDNAHAVFFASPREVLDYHYERNPQDPRISHQMVLEIDDFGNTKKSVALAYPRLNPAYPEQGKTPITLTESEFTPAVETDSAYRSPSPYETSTFEVTGTAPDGFLFFWDKMEAEAKTLEEIPYEQQPDLNKKQKRIIESARVLYYKDDLSGPEPLGICGTLGLVYESYKLAFTSGLTTQVYGNRVDSALLKSEGKYIEGKDIAVCNDFRDTSWWMPSGHPVYDLARAKFYLPVEFHDSYGGKKEYEYDDYDLLLKLTKEPLKNVLRTGNDYRVMQPELITYPNNNRTQVVFDALGIVVGTAVMGKDDPNNVEGDSLEGFVVEPNENLISQHFIDPHNDPHTLLKKATTRYIYDFNRYEKSRQFTAAGGETGDPGAVCTISRITHESTLAENSKSKLQLSIAFYDGLGRNIQKKIQAAPDPTTGELRWIGSGWVILNNKGNPVEKYEPFFSLNASFEYNPAGVSSKLFYDPLGRNLATLHPNHTYQKTIFDAWQEKAWDQNDNIHFEDPKSDLDIGWIFNKLKDEDYLPSWYAGRKSGQMGSEEQDAAEKSYRHRNTPVEHHKDNLGRKFLIIADNGVGEYFHSYTKFDIRGKALEIKDPRGVVTFQNAYDISGRQISTKSADAGLKISLFDIEDNPIRTWDANQVRVGIKYDILRRVDEVWVKPAGQSEYLAEKTIYGESLCPEVLPAGAPDPAKTKYHRGQVYQVYDNSGMVEFGAYDFKGNILSTKRYLLKNDITQIHWNQPGGGSWDKAYAHTQLVTQEPMEQIQAYDAMNRSVSNTMPDGSFYVVSYDDSGLLFDANLDLKKANGSIEKYNFIKSIEYNEKGERNKIEYGNGVITKYTYDTQTYLLRSLISKKDSGTKLQQLEYTYDSVGNITRVHDGTIKTIYHNQQEINGISDFTYDALSRLITATGREHRSVGAAHYRKSTTFKQSEYIPVPGPPPITDSQALQMYTETYNYDRAGNLIQLKHRRGTSENSPVIWTRNQEYEKDALGNPKSSRIANSGAASTDINMQDARFDYEYDANGNISKMPHLDKLSWDHENRLFSIDFNSNGMKSYCQYDAKHQRVVKKIKKNGITEMRIYLGQYELFRKYRGQNLIFERKIIHVVDDKQRFALIEFRTKDLENNESGQLETRIRYQLGNHLFSSMREIDETLQANTISYEEFYPYGGTSFIGGKNQIEVQRKRYRYCGKEKDDESGLYYFGFRYYAPWLCSWISVDSEVERAPHVSAYNYCFCNPVIFMDSEGKYPQGALELWVKNEGPAKAREGMKIMADKITSTAKGLGKAYEKGSTADKVEIIATGVGAAGGVVPYAGDYISLGASVVSFFAKPSLSSAGDIGLDAIGAVLPFVPAMGTIRRIDRTIDLATDTRRLANTGDTAADAARYSTPDIPNDIDPKKIEVLEEFEDASNLGRHNAGSGSIPEGTHKSTKSTKPKTSASSSPSEILGKKLEKAGKPKPGPGYDAHHIIPESDPRGAKARKLLKEADIDINSADNGIWLPRGADISNPDALLRHEFTFNDEYFEGVEAILESTSPEMRGDAMKYIHEILSTGQIPWK